MYTSANYQRNHPIISVTHLHMLVHHLFERAALHPSRFSDEAGFLDLRLEKREEILLAGWLLFAHLQSNKQFWAYNFPKSFFTSLLEKSVDIAEITSNPADGVTLWCGHVSCSSSTLLSIA
ncbi:hypothetical protein E6O75_ATG01752 [Venturia nashicola]|uniref:Uncharacterized protein n=1 Tax=Venturia nashicola TaxID=86259 RepID=A0A4Z1NYL1_9PEZI|nr:hypothetical protein E6O75_ATG01752 [Venturia nashicola]